MNTFPTRGRMAQKFVEMRVSDSPMLRRASDTEAVISVFEESVGESLSGLPEDESSSTLVSSFDFQSIKNAIQQQLDDLSDSSQQEIRVSEEEQQEQQRHFLRRADARYQRRHVAKNANIILKDDIKFRQFKEAIKQTGMLTANGVKQVLLSPTVDERNTSRKAKPS